MNIQPSQAEKQHSYMKKRVYLYLYYNRQRFDNYIQRK